MAILPRSETSIIGNKTVLTSNTLILAANGGRIHFEIYNDDSTNYIELSFGVNAEAGKGIRLQAGQSWKMSSINTGAVYGIADTGSVIVSFIDY